MMGPRRYRRAAHVGGRKRAMTRESAGWVMVRRSSSIQTFAGSESRDAGSLLKFRPHS